MLAGPSPSGWAEDLPNATLAEVNGKPITMADLQKGNSAQLLDARYRVYLAEHGAVTQAINDALLREQADKEHLSVDQLLDRHVKNQMTKPDESMLKGYYAALKVNQPFSDVRDQILKALTEKQEQEAGEKYLESLRKKADVKLMIEPPSVSFALSDAIPAVGPKDAPVTFIEFGDYECPYCRKVDPAMQKLREHYGDKLRFAFVNFPLPMHSHARKAAEAALCANAQNKFWPFHERLYASDGQSLEVPALKTLARSLGLDGARFDKCLDSNEETAAVQKTLDAASNIGLTATPSFLVNGHFVSGALPYEALQQAVEEELARPKAAQAAAAN